MKQYNHLPRGNHVWKLAFGVAGVEIGYTTLIGIAERVMDLPNVVEYTPHLLLGGTAAVAGLAGGAVSGFVMGGAAALFTPRGWRYLQDYALAGIVAGAIGGATVGSVSGVATAHVVEQTAFYATDVLAYNGQRLEQTRRTIDHFFSQN